MLRELQQAWGRAYPAVLEQAGVTDDDLGIAAAAAPESFLGALGLWLAEIWQALGAFDVDLDGALTAVRAGFDQQRIEVVAQAAASDTATPLETEVCEESAPGTGSADLWAQMRWLIESFRVQHLAQVPPHWRPAGLLAAWDSTVAAVENEMGSPVKSGIGGGNFLRCFKDEAESFSGLLTSAASMHHLRAGFQQHLRLWEQQRTMSLSKAQGEKRQDLANHYNRAFDQLNAFAVKVGAPTTEQIAPYVHRRFDEHDNLRFLKEQLPAVTPMLELLAYDDPDFRHAMRHVDFLVRQPGARAEPALQYLTEAARHQVAHMDYWASGFRHHIDCIATQEIRAVEQEAKTERGYERCLFFITWANGILRHYRDCGVSTRRDVPVPDRNEVDELHARLLSEAEARMKTLRAQQG
jgi:hypothetical protein